MASPEGKDENVNGVERPWGSRGWPATRIGVGALLVAASLLKAHFLLTKPFLSYAGVLSLRWTSVILVEVELLIGLWLVFGVAPRLTRGLSLVLFVGLALAAGSKVWAGDEDCGCLGQLPVKPGPMFVLDVGVLAALVIGRPSERAWAPRGFLPILPTGLALALGAALAFHPISIRFDIPEDGPGDSGQRMVVILDPKKWSGHKFALRKQIVIDENLDQGYWTVVLFRMKCDQCQKVLDRFRKAAAQQTETTEEEPETAEIQIENHIAFIEVPPFSGEGENRVKDYRRFVYGRLNPEWEWFIQTPTIIQVANGRVIRVISAADAGRDCQGCSGPHFLH